MDWGGPEDREPEGNFCLVSEKQIRLPTHFSTLSYRLGFREHLLKGHEHLKRAGLTSLCQTGWPHHVKIHGQGGEVWTGTDSTREAQARLVPFWKQVSPWWMFLLTPLTSG